MDVVILAGGRCDPSLRAVTGKEFRADVEIGGRTLAQIVLDATLPLGEPILVGGPPGYSARRVESGDTYPESLRNGLDAVKTDKFLLVTVDLPCLTTEALQDFVSHCDPTAGMNFPVVRIEDCERMFPSMKRTTLKLREGTVTGGNVALMGTEAMRRTLPVMESAYTMRKKPLRLAKMVGIGVLARVVFGQVMPKSLPLARLEEGVGRFLGTKVHAVISRYPELGADLDKASDYEGFANRLRLQEP